MLILRHHPLVMISVLAVSVCLLASSWAGLVDGSRLFDHVALAYGSNIRTGHELSNCPTILAGGGAGLKLGQHIVAPRDTPLCNAWLALLQGVGVEAERHGDSTGVLKEILA